MTNFGSTDELEDNQSDSIKQEIVDMSLPLAIQNTFSPEELQFLVENEPIQIFPRITTRERSSMRSERSKWNMLTMDDHNLNNMVAMQSTTVTLWIALLLKQQDKCNIIPPSWLTNKALDKAIQYEKQNKLRFSRMDWNWLPLSEMLFKKAQDDFHDPIHELRSRIQDLREIRQVKVIQGLKFLNESHLQLDNLSLFEINELRPFVVGIMDKLREVHDASLQPNENGEYDEDDHMNDNVIPNDFDFGTLKSEASRM